MKTNDVIGLGSALMDFLVQIDDNKLLEYDLKKGEMHLVDEIKAKKILEKIQNPSMKIEIIPGGSAANTLKGVALLGGNVIMAGSVGNDAHGQMYVEEIQKHGVTTKMKTHPSTTGHCVSFITPDSERTMSTHLGAAIHLEKQDVLEEDIANSKVLHLEGYQLEGSTKDVVLHAIEFAKKHNTLVSLDLADPALIRRNKDFFIQLVKDSIDIVFVNETEALEFTGVAEMEALNVLADSCSIAVVKLGARGSLISQDGKIQTIPSYPADAVDTTGAGDSYAAGLLYGFCNGWDLEKAGSLGSLLASKVVEQQGVGMRDITGEQLKENFINSIKIGIIGGSGLDNPNILTNVGEKMVDTPFGKPSSSLKIGNIGKVSVVLLARHGHNHSIPPTQVNYRANIHALKEAGCTHILATTACGSLREEIRRGDLVILDQFIDYTRHRKISFFEEFKLGEARHTPMARPFNEMLRNKLIETCQNLNLKHHPSGTVITIEGPRFSTIAESKMFRLFGADVINMSVAPETILANELGIPYAAIAMSTDYDCWKADEKPVTWDEILAVFGENVEKVTKLLVATIPNIEVNSTKDTFSNGFDLKSTIRTVPNWPKPGVMFRDITTLLQSPEAFQYCINKFKQHYQGKNITKVAGIEARGFIFGAALARELHLPLVLIRKKGKLPSQTIAVEYELEYGKDHIEVHTDAITKDDNVLIVDDLIATGGTAKATCQLIEKLGANVTGLAFVIDLPDLKGREKLQGYDIFNLVEYLGE
jgi:5'-methylthioadenosine phosphorylase